MERLNDFASPRQNDDDDVVKENDDDDDDDDMDTVNSDDMPGLRQV